MIMHVVDNTYVIVADDVVLIAGQPLPESQWNGRGRRYTIRYWPCHHLDGDEGRSAVNTEDEDVVSLTIGGLEEWTAYCVQLSACNERGCSEDGGTTVSTRTLESGISSTFSNCFKLSKITFTFLKLLFTFLNCFLPFQTAHFLDLITS